jgi:phosphoribosylamine--glycine ligase
MGTYSPAPILSPTLTERARVELIEPALRGIAAEGSPYRGALFCEMMLTPDGPKLVEFNVRFGDPECQVLMLRLESDLVPYLAAAAQGRLGEMAAPKWRDDHAICVVLAAEGYPTAPKSGSVIRGAEADLGEDVVVFHAGTERGAAGQLVANGGRVLNVCATGASLQAARDRAYAAIARIDWPQGFHRTDIAAKALAR